MNQDNNISSKKSIIMMDTSINSDVELIPKIGSGKVTSEGKYRDEAMVNSGS